MTRAIPGAAQVRLTLAVLVAAVLGACMGSPFERVNPNDPEAEFTLTMTASADSSRTIGEVIDFTVTITPPSPGYVPEWSVSHPALERIATGQYEVVALPSVGSLPVVVSARFAGRTASKTVTLRPALP